LTVGAKFFLSKLKIKRTKSEEHLSFCFKYCSAWKVSGQVYVAYLQAAKNFALGRIPHSIKQVFESFLLPDGQKQYCQQQLNHLDTFKWTKVSTFFGHSPEIWSVAHRKLMFLPRCLKVCCEKWKVAFLLCKMLRFELFHLSAIFRLNLYYHLQGHTLRYFGITR